MDGCREIPMPVMPCVYFMETFCSTGHYFEDDFFPRMYCLIDNNDGSLLSEVSVLPDFHSH